MNIMEKRLNSRWSEFKGEGSINNLYANFLAPPDEFRPVPWLCYTGRLTEEEIVYAIEQMHEQGIRSFFIFPIYGMEKEYLSDEWFEIVRKTLELCQEKGMTVWLYDDYCWPNGTCGGKLLEEHPEYNIKSFNEWFSGWVEPGETIDKEYTCSTVKIFYISREEEIIKSQEVRPIKNKITLTNDTGKPIKFLCVNSEYNTSQMPSLKGALWQKNKKTKGYLDWLNHNAVECFITMTYNKYFKLFKKYFKNTIVGFFNDEPALKGICDNKDLSSEFYSKYGYKFEDHIECFYTGSGLEMHKMRAGYFKLAGEIFGDNIAKINSWCVGHGVDFTGHFLGEESPGEEVASQAALWPVRKNMSLPGIDLLGCGSNYEAVPSKKSFSRPNTYINSGNVLTAKLGAATARFNGSSRVMCEAFGVMPYDTCPVDMKANTAWLNAMGINMINDNTLTLSIKDFRKNALGGKHFTQPWWKHYQKFADFCARSSFLSSLGQSTGEIAMLYPVLTAQCLYTMDKESEDRKLLCKTNHITQQTAEALVRKHYQWEIIFEELVEEGTVSDGKLSVKGNDFSTLLVPGAVAISEKVFAKLEKLAKAEGQIVFTGFLPSLSIEDSFNLNKRLADLMELENVHLIEFSETENWLDFEEDLKKTLGCSSQINMTGINSENILATRKRALSNEICQFVNMSSKDAEISIPATGQTYEIFHPDNGQFFKPDYRGKKIRLKFSPWESYFLVSCANSGNYEKKELALPSGELADAPPYSHSLHIPNIQHGQWFIESPFDETWEIELTSPNMTRLPQEIAFDISNPEWLKCHKNCMPLNVYPEENPCIWVKCTFEVEHVPNHLSAVLDNVCLEAFANGKHIAPPETYTLWDKGNIKYDISDKCQRGTNELLFKIPVSEYYHKDIGLQNIIKRNFIDPIALIGDFSASLEPKDAPVLGKPLKYLTTESWHAQGLSHYSGTVIYRQEVDLPKLPCNVILDIGNIGVVADVKVNGYNSGVLCWPPYRINIGKSIRAGSNLFEISVSNTLGSLLIFEHFNWSGKRIASPKSGLMGPIKLICSKTT
jgi:hypothetical protein